MNRICRRSVAAAMLIVFLGGCSPVERDLGPRYETTSLSGVVHVDGEPATAVTVECHPEPGTSELKAPLSVMTDENGEFSFGLYEKGGGVPAGKYRLVFRWELFESRMNDKLNGAYAEPNDSKFTVTVEEGEPADLGVIELSADPAASPPRALPLQGD